MIAENTEKTNKHLLMVNILHLLQFSAMKGINDQKLFQEPEDIDIDMAFINGDLALRKV